MSIDDDYPIKSKCKDCEHCITFNNFTYLCDIATEYIGVYSENYDEDMITVNYHVIPSYTNEDPKWCPIDRHG